MFWPGKCTKSYQNNRARSDDNLASIGAKCDIIYTGKLSGIWVFHTRRFSLDFKAYHWSCLSLSCILSTHVGIDLILLYFVFYNSEHSTTFSEMIRPSPYVSAPARLRACGAAPSMLVLYHAVPILVGVLWESVSMQSKTCLAKIFPTSNSITRIGSFNN